MQREQPLSPATNKREIKSPAAGTTSKDAPLPRPRSSSAPLSHGNAAPAPQVARKGFLVTDSGRGKRVDVYLTEQLPQLGRSRIQQLLREGKAGLAPAMELKPGHRLRGGEHLWVELSPGPSRADLKATTHASSLSAGGAVSARPRAAGDAMKITDLPKTLYVPARRRGPFTAYISYRDYHGVSHIPVFRSEAKAQEWLNAGGRLHWEERWNKVDPFPFDQGVVIVDELARDDYISTVKAFSPESIVDFEPANGEAFAPAERRMPVAQR